ncbi:MAG TPA: hypothetical protein VNG34_13405 [Actinomycetota bacterium]|nr:hypothetical protein [Actinomycetota bacterium]
MPNLTQRATHRVRDTAQTALARTIQMTSQFLGRFTPRVPDPHRARGAGVVGAGVSHVRG